jgi:hypothetical protein
LKREIVADALRVLTVIALGLIATYLVKIYGELQGIRREQVKNLLYAQPSSKPQPKGLLRQELESSVMVQSSVNIEGAVEIQEPVEVEGSVSIEH